MNIVPEDDGLIGDGLVPDERMSDEHSREIVESFGDCLMLQLDEGDLSHAHEFVLIP